MEFVQVSKLAINTDKIYCHNQTEIIDHLTEGFVEFTNKVFS